MLIGFDAKRAFTNTSGLGNYSRFIISSLATAYPNNEYLLYTPRQNQLFNNFYPANANVHVIQPEGWGKKLSSLWRVLGLSAQIRKDQLAIYHGLSNELPVNVRKSGAKAIVTIHDLIFLRYPALYNPIDRAIYTYKFRSACKQAHRIIAISEQTKQDIVSYFKIAPAKIDVIYQDCDPVFHAPVDENIKIQVRQKYQLPGKYVLSVGTHEPRKNQLNLLKAWHQAGTDHHLVLAGRQTAYTTQLKSYIAQENLQDRVHFLPYVQFDELPAIYQMADLFAYPSVFEGFGIPILEALNSGVPVITSSGSCFREAGGNAALYVMPEQGQVDALAKAIRQLDTDAALREQMIKEGYKHALLFRPEQTTAQLHQLYLQVLKA
ncbi:glycosyltransferase family 4 protein [Pontibacter sp. MBLB2868]|uniref:glycosyltransferase family 4 protein n=1 Tax=Pontibacter sp. MBLB2868 TaxID=3451555 RepID=UPI003F7565CC